MKLKTLFLICSLSLFINSCSDNGKAAPKLSVGMIKVSIMYPNTEDGTFNMEYYKKNHMPMLKELFGDVLKHYAIESGISGRTAEEPATYLAVGHLYLNTLEDYQKSFGKHAETILNDIPNYTNIKPVVQISKVVK